MYKELYGEYAYWYWGVKGLNVPTEYWRNPILHNKLNYYNHQSYDTYQTAYTFNTKH